jgi:Pilus formation protein N terminal region
MSRLTFRIPTAFSAIHTSCFAAAALLAAVTLEATKARADDLIVRYDQAQLLRLPRPVSEIIIGNPSIADVAIQGGNLLVITGKTYGVTNVIALDAERNIIQDQRIMVERDQHSVVSLHRGGSRTSWNCTPNCAPMLSIGDEILHFESILRQNTGKTKFSESGSEGDRGGQ